MKATVTAIEFSIPDTLVGNDELASAFGDWTPDKIVEKTGISERYVAGKDECASDLGVAACRKLFESGRCKPEDIDYLLLCTQSPDYFLPTTACIMQDRLGLPTKSGALDFNLGCSGFVYGLGLAKGLIETGQAKNVLLVTAETYSKFLHQKDRSVRTIFGDGAAATLIQGIQHAANTREEPIGAFVYGTDGRGAKNLIVPVGGMRQRTPATTQSEIDSSGNERTSSNLYMNGAEIFSFTLRAVPAAVQQLLETTQLTLNDVDLFVFHQANQFMLDHLQKKIKIPSNKFVVTMGRIGNTVSSTIPIALSECAASGRLVNGQRVMLVGFGVGYSWAATVIRWRMGLGSVS